MSYEVIAIGGLYAVLFFVLWGAIRIAKQVAENADNIERMTKRIADLRTQLGNAYVISEESYGVPPWYGNKVPVDIEALRRSFVLLTEYLKVELQTTPTKTEYVKSRRSNEEGVRIQRKDIR